MAYTRVNWKDLPSTDTPINAENLNKMDEEIYNNSSNIGDLTSLNTINKNNLVYAINEVNKMNLMPPGSNIEEFKAWLITSAAPNANFMCFLNFNGAVSSALVAKASNDYLSFIHFSYSITAKQYKYVNGTWYEVSL
jgi:hypothetical protein